MGNPVKVSFLTKENDDSNGLRGLAERHIQRFKDIPDAYAFIKKMKANPYIGTKAIVGSPSIE